MGIGPIVSLGASYLQSLVSGSANSSSPGNTTASNGLSGFAQILSSLQTLQQSNPSQYQQVTQQISTNLQTAARTATPNGNNSLASELTQLSKDFQIASSSGQLPSVSDLAQAIGDGHSRHHRGGGGDPLSIVSAALTNAGATTTAS